MTASSQFPTPTWVSDLHTTRPCLGIDTGYKKVRNICTVLKEASRDRHDRVLFVSSDGSQITTGDFYKLARRIAKGIIAAQVEPGRGICILGANSVEWFAADWGSVLAACIPAPSYVTNSSDVIAHILEHSKAGVCFVDDEETLLKTIAAVAHCKDLKSLKVVTWDSSFNVAKFRDHASYIFRFDEFLESGNVISDSILEQRMEAAGPESCAKLIYTSGTTGFPKAVMISHDNLLYMANALIDQYDVTMADTLVSYLPASHIAANSLDCTGPVAAGVTVYIADRNALRGSLVDSLRKFRPTIFFAVPRVWEKIEERMIAIRSNMNPIKRAVSTWARSVGSAACLAEESGMGYPFGTFIADKLIFSNVRKALGLDRARILISTAAPLQKTTQDYFRSLRMKISQVYGLSEATGSFTSGHPDHYKYSSCGKLLNGVEIKFANNGADDEGELCFRGRNVFLGYLSNSEESAKTIDADGYLHTGDLGHIDQDGFLFVTGRAKDLLITAGGENVAPELIESSLLAEMPAISRACAVGDGRKYISCLLIPFMDDMGNLSGLAARVSDKVDTAAEAVNDESWMSYIRNGIETVNKTAISNVAKVKRFTLLPRDFSVDPQDGWEQGELTPTLKVRRNVVVKNYAREIDAMYS